MEKKEISKEEAFEWFVRGYTASGAESVNPLVVDPLSPEGRVKLRQIFEGRWKDTQFERIYGREE